MARSVETGTPAPQSTAPRDPGETLIELLNFAEQITPFTPARSPEPLAFPPLARLAEATRRRRGNTGGTGDSVM
jgi:hypothetical protein